MLEIDHLRGVTKSFQSAPAIAGGRCGFWCCRLYVRQMVSIRARHCWRAMPPPAWESEGAHDVSIRARHCWRAMLDVIVHGERLGPFQSAPAIAGGRCRAIPWAQPRTGRFNPRPPLLAGDARANAAERLQIQDVSIRARHCWRAMPASQRAPMPANSFQSAPAIAGGRCFGGRLAPIHRQQVSIRARHCWRAMPRGALPARGDRQVSIRARHCWRAMPPPCQRPC